MNQKKRPYHPVHRAYHIARRTFLIRLSYNIGYGFLLTVLSLYLGMAGYHFTENMSWVDAYVNASMILSGMGPVSTLQTTVGKIFAGSYAIFSGVLFLIIMAIIFGPVIHWILIKFHMTDKK